MAIRPETVIAGRYRVVGRVGTGGMGSVSLAEDDRLGRRVAIKRVHPERADGVSARFRREMKIGAAVNHPNLVTVYDAIIEDAGVLIVMEYVEGQSLADALRPGSLAPPRALDILEAAAAGLDHLHGAGVVHRDVKPANILLGIDGAVKLADFGIASSPGMTRITQSGALMGTVSYIAPELFNGEPATGASDIYSLAAVAFEALGGRKARPGRTPVEIARQALDAPAPDLHEAWPQAPVPVVKALCRALGRDLAARPSSGAELVALLREALVPEGRQAPQQRQLAPDAKQDAGAAAVASEPASTEAWKPAERTPAALPPRSSRPQPPATGAAASAARPPGRPDTTAGREHTSPRRRAWPLLAAFGGIVAIVAVLVVSSLGVSDRSPAPRNAAAPQTPKRPKPAPTPVAGDGAARAVTSFYEEAAAGRYEQAWALAAPGLRTQLGGFGAFRSQFRSLRSIRFNTAQTTDAASERATVAISTVAVHTNRTDRCSGIATVVRSDRWQVDHIDVSC